MSLGPIQIVVIALDDALGESSRLVDEFLALRASDAVRLVALLAVAKEEDGRLVVESAPAVDGDPDAELLVVTSLLGRDQVGDERALGIGPAAGVAGDESLPPRQRWAVSDCVPQGTRAAVAVLEHRWAKPLRAAVRQEHGVALEDTWVDGADLIGLQASSRPD